MPGFHQSLNAQCPCGHVTELYPPSQLCKRALEWMEKGKIDALPLSSDECDECLDARIARAKRHLIALCPGEHLCEYFSVEKGCSVCPDYIEIADAAQKKEALFELTSVISAAFAAV